MTDTIRAKQQREVLDVWRNVHSQVMGRERKQVEAFPDTRLPKTQRDTDSEVNVDKAVEQLNAKMEQKLGFLEFFIQHIGDFAEKKYTQQLIVAQQQIVQTGDVIPVWNAIVRSYQQFGLSPETKQVMKIKVQELLPNLDAMTYGLKKAMDGMFAILDYPMVDGEFIEEREKELPKAPGGIILDVLRTFAVYRFMKEQSDTGYSVTLELLTVPLLDREFQNSFDELSSERIRILKSIAPDASSLTNTTVRNVPDFPVDDFEGRIKALESELGFRIPVADIQKLKLMSQRHQKEAMAKMKNELAPLATHTVTHADTQRLQELQRVLEKIDDLIHLEEKLVMTHSRLEEEIQQLEEGRHISAQEAEQYFKVLPALPVKPEPPVLGDADFVDQMEEYVKAKRQWEEQEKEYLDTKAHNEFLDELLIQGEAQREQAIHEKRRMIEELEEEFESGQRLGEQLVSQRENLSAVYMANTKRFRNRNVFHKLLELYNTQAIPVIAHEREDVARRLVEEEEPDEKVGEGKKGRPVDTRGKASLRHHYGVADQAEEDDDCLAFDDRRNEQYYVRPK